MSVPSEKETDLENQREKIIGLGELSIRKSYYPELQRKHAELLKKNEELQAAYEELTATEEELHQNYNELSSKEQQLREKETWLSSILHGLPVMQFVIDHNHHVISWNRAIEKYSGIRAEGIINTDGQWRAFYSEKRPLLADILVDESFDLLSLYYKEKFRKSRFIDEGYEVTDFFPKMGDSGKWLIATAVPIRDAQGHITGAIETLEDITKRKRAEEEMIKSEKFLNNVFENIPDMIFVKDAKDLRFVRFNKAGEELLGYKRDELYGKNDSDFFPKDEADFFTGKDRDVLRLKQILDISEEKIQTRLKGERILHTKKIPILDETGNPVYLMGISEDITDYKQTEEALNLARNKMALLNAVTFQDIQSAAFGLTAYHELLKTVINDEKGQMYLENQVSLNQKIIDSLNFAKNYQDMGIKPPRWQNVNHVFLLAISHLDFLHIARNISFEDLEIYADPLLEMVFVHLMQNVLTHGIHATQVTLYYQEKPDNLTLFIEDNGAGIPAEEKQIIFDRGYGKNTGLGLFFAREVLSITKMTIKETGEAGKGARFEINVPKGGYRFVSMD
jgi:PAS domain S-box-containing protein